MPIYNYWYQACGYEEEKLLTQTQAKEGLFSCPKCSARLAKQFGNIAHFEFKGNLKKV